MGTKWEQLPLGRAPDGFVMLSPALPYLHKPARILAGDGQVHSWGSRGRGFNACPPGSLIPRPAPRLVREESRDGR